MHSDPPHPAPRREINETTIVRPPRHGIAFWLMMFLALVLLAVGLALAVGGAWLIALGGSWYYLPAGLALILAGALMMAQRMAGVWVYALTWALTWAWAVWEVGLDLWPLVPRVVAPTVLLVLVLLTIPVLRRRENWRRRPAAGVAVALALLVPILPGLTAGGAAWAQETPPATPAPEPAPEPDPAPAPTPEPAPEAELAPAPAPTGEDAAEEDATEEAAVRPPMPVRETGADWPEYGGTIHGTRYSPLEQITRENVGQLQRIWEYRTGDMPPETEGEPPSYAAETTPIKIGRDLFLCTAMGDLISLDAATGLEIWRHELGVPLDAIPYNASCRGVAHYRDPDAAWDAPCAARVLVGTLDARLVAVDARTGQACTDFGQNGQVDLELGMGHTVPGWVSVTSPPLIVRGVAVVGHQVSDNQRRDAPSGVVRGYDALTGDLVWAWDMVRPDRRGLPPEGETYSRGTPNMWTIAAGDEELGHVYLPMGNSSVDYYGAERTEAENDYATALVAVDVTTGEAVWRFQTVYYDVWDYDLGSQPTLLDFPTEDGTVPAALLSTKQGDIYVLDRRTGEPLFPVEEREVPSGGVEPENLSPVQPFSTYHSLIMPPLEEVNMWGMSPLDQLWCRIQFRRAAYAGVYQPPTVDRYWIQYPGYNGGQDWGSMAIDPERGILIANYNDIPNHNRLIPREEADEMGAAPIDSPLPGMAEGPRGVSPQGGVPYAIDVNAGWRVPATGLICKEPPYGGIRAIDIATGETLWDQPFGDARRNGPWGIPSFLPVTIGTPNNGGPVVTSSGLIFIAATTDDMIRALDIETGEILWQDRLPAGGQSTPLTYEEGGRQLLVLMAGGHTFMETPIGDQVIAWALPGPGGEQDAEE